MITSIAQIRARHPGAGLPAALAAVVPPPEAPRARAMEPAPAPRTEAAEWLATVDKADITRTRRAGGGYALHVGQRLVVLVEPPDKEGRHVVVNVAAGRVRSPALARHWADTLALRIARNEALT